MSDAYEKKKDAQRAWREKNREYVNRKRREWAATEEGKEKIREYNRRQREKKPYVPRSKPEGYVPKEEFASTASDPRHGTVNGYSNLRCRCDRCTEAWAVNHKVYMQKYRARKKEES